MNDNTAVVTVIIGVVAIIASVLGFGINASKHTGDNVHKTSIECIQAGKEWRKIAPSGRTSFYWSCVSPE